MKSACTALLVRWWWLCLVGCLTPAVGAPTSPVASPVAPPVAAPVASTPAVELHEARFRPVTTPGAEPWSTVALPHTWAANGLPRFGRGQYQLQFELGAAPTGVWALRIDRLSTAYRLHVNGVLVQQPGGDAEADFETRVLIKPVPVLVSFPARLLHAGSNQIDIEWRLGARAGMSTVQLGPSALLQPAFEQDHLYDQTLPQLLNAAGAALALFMLTIWSQLRRERAIGLFGLLWLLVSVRNFSYLVNATPWPVIVSNWLFFVAQVVSAALLGAFAVALSPEPWRRFQRVLWGLVTVLPALGLLGVANGSLASLRQWAYPVLLLTTVFSLFVLLRAVRRARRRSLVALLVGLSAVLVAGAHDYLFHQGLLPVTHMFWLPYAVPLGSMWYALVLLQRMVEALRNTEELAARLETRVAERTEELDQAHQAQSRFLAAASHDLRQPVVAIGLLLGLARERAQGLDLRGLLDRAQEATRALEDLVRGLLDLSRLDDGPVARPRQAVPLQALFQAIAAHEQPAALGKGLRLRFRPTQRVVWSDPLLLEQILRNLVGNAIRYTDRGGVLVVARASAAGVRLQVWDTGRGIAPADQQRVFEAFVQLDNPGRDRSQGQGLGLAIVRRSADLLAHPLGLRSVPARGTCFSLDLPLADATAPLATATAGPAQPLQGRTVWLLDDDPAVREALAERLAAWGATVHHHASLAELDTRLASSGPAPDWLLTDHRLPEGDGTLAIQRVRARCGAVPALLITGDTAPAVMAQLSAQALDVLHKPFRPEALLAWLQRVSSAPPLRRS
ncbi:MAG: response regulator [Rubrivivax sp.]|nr:response regulator [Rubrivivax sp.]